METTGQAGWPASMVVYPTRVYNFATLTVGTSDLQSNNGAANNTCFTQNRSTIENWSTLNQWTKSIHLDLLMTNFSMSMTHWTYNHKKTRMKSSYHFQYQKQFLDQQVLIPVRHYSCDKRNLKLQSWPFGFNQFNGEYHSIQCNI